MPPKKDSNKDSKLSYALPELQLENQAVIVPLSIGTEYHKNPTLLASFFETLVEKIHLGLISNITFVVSDTLQAYNKLFNQAPASTVRALPSEDETSSEIKTAYLLALKQWHIDNSATIMAAKATALIQGNTWLTENAGNLKKVKRAFDRTNPTVNSNIMRWNDCLATDIETTSGFADKIAEAYSTNTSFSKEINSLIQAVTARKSAPDATEAVKAHNQMCCAAYVFEELAIFAQWMQANKWDCLIYPFSQSPFNAKVFEFLTIMFPAPAESKILMPIDAVITNTEAAKELKATDRAQLAARKAERLARSAEASLTATPPILIPGSHTSPSSSISSVNRRPSAHSSNQSSRHTSPGTSPPSEPSAISSLVTGVTNSFAYAQNSENPTAALEELSQALLHLSRFADTLKTKPGTSAQPPAAKESAAIISFVQPPPAISVSTTTDRAQQVLTGTLLTTAPSPKNGRFND